MAVTSCFSTQILQQNLGPKTQKLIKDLIVESNKLSQVDREGLSWSKENYLRGYTSYASMDQLFVFSSTFKDLQTLIDSKLSAFLKATSLDLKPKDLFMSKMWVNVMGPDCTHPAHIHPFSVISGTFYLAVPKGSPGIKFEDPRLTSFMARPTVSKTAHWSQRNFVQLKTKPGDLVLFESWVRHEVPPNQSQNPRISVSFNYDLK